MSFFTQAIYIPGSVSAHDATDPILYVTPTRIDIVSGSGLPTQSYILSGPQAGALTTSAASPQWTFISGAGLGGQIATNHLTQLDTATSPHSVSVTFGNSGFYGDRVTLLALPDQDLLLAASASGAGLTTLSTTASTPTALRNTNDTTLAYADCISAMAAADLGAETYVFTASATEHGVSAWRVNTSGSLIFADSLGAAEGVGIQTPTALTTVEAYGTTYLLTGAAGSNSISVMAVHAGGQLSLTDHVVDTLMTRFGGVQVMDSLTIDGTVFVVAGGGDDGLALFTLTPDGTLVHLESLAHAAGLGLNAINGLALSAQDSTLTIAATSQTHPGVTIASVDLGGLNFVTGSSSGTLITGSNASDWIWDGAGEDSLVGGGQADIFVFSADGTRDVIEDFNPAQDRVDLSNWAGLYGVLQLDITPTHNGARLRYGDEELRIITHNGQSLTLADFLETDLLGLWRPEILPGEALTLTGTATSDLMRGQTGNDRLMGKAGSDDMAGNSGNDTLIGDAGNDTLMGDAGNDVLNGGRDNDRLDGGTGRDTLYGGDGADSLFGGTGTDQLRAGGGGDHLYGGSDGDTLWGEAGHDRIEGGDGNDRLEGGTGGDTLIGGTGNDTLIGGTSTDELLGQDGNDSLTGGTGADTLFGGDGNDRIFGNTALDTVYGGAGDDYISSGDGVDLAEGGDGDDTIYGRSGWDTLIGGRGDDSIIGSEGVDSLVGNSGQDWLSGGSGWDSLFGGGDDDTLYGNFGSDHLLGGANADALFGGTGDDTAYGGSGNDTIQGNQGVDVIEGGPGRDLLRGGTQRDTFIFHAGHGRDEINDFEISGDTLRISAVVVNGTGSSQQVVATYGEIRNAEVVLDFGNGNSITLSNLSSLNGLANAIEIF